MRTNTMWIAFFGIVVGVALVAVLATKLRGGDKTPRAKATTLSSRASTQSLTASGPLDKFTRSLIIAGINEGDSVWIRSRSRPWRLPF